MVRYLPVTCKRATGLQTVLKPKQYSKAMSESTTYKIKQTQEGYCTCGHPGAAHGSNGFICCACDCKKFFKLKSPEELIVNTNPNDVCPCGSNDCEL